MLTRSKTKTPKPVPSAAQTEGTGSWVWTRKVRLEKVEERKRGVGQKVLTLQSFAKTAAASASCHS
ncbi:hypothetical protein, partial [Corynebacterium sp.]|uniref:hypothetical protein n=1 Tax=Corynebacterium sp. TaxID=1720 RepID=UPI002907B38B